MKKAKSEASERHLRALAEHAEWEWLLGQVVGFRQQHGHVELGNHPAGVWLEGMRQQALEGKLSALKRQRLAEGGLPMPKAVRRRKAVPMTADLPKEEAAWERLYARLDAWQELHGHCKVPRAWGADPELARWTQEQRRRRIQRRLSPTQVERLEALDFFKRRRGGPNPASWTRRYAEMVAFQKEHGHTNVTGKVNKQLSFWRETQRETRKMGMLSAERIARLDEIGFEWEAPGRAGLEREAWHQQLWEAKLEQVVAFKERFGHCHVPVLWEEDRKLGSWVADQRKRWRGGKLAADRMGRLEGMGFKWKVPHRFFQPPFPTERRPAQGYIDLWERRYAELVAYAHEHGDTNVSKSENKMLNHWRDVQRQFRKKGTLSAERIARLDEIGFEWEASHMMGMEREAAQVQAWEERLERLRAFHARCGHTQMPQGWPEDRELGTWVSTQRRAKSHGYLLPEREARLEELGFDWQPVKARMRIARRERNYPATLKVLWEQRYAELVAFHEEHGHCRVPTKKPEVQALCKWCYSQRHFRRDGKLLAERVAKLDALGFRWDATEVPGLSFKERLEQMWEQSFARLVAFHARFGHAQVPVRWEEDKELGRWVDKQRQKARQGRLSPEKRARLEALGFPWQPDNTLVLKPPAPQDYPKPAHEKTWLRHLEELRAFQQ